MERRVGRLVKRFAHQATSFMARADWDHRMVKLLMRVAASTYSNRGWDGHYVIAVDIEPCFSNGDKRLGLNDV
ncbi:hypothetical protein VNO77_41669 [Canavalia gladiata]|uniref:Uncharacterized protein n=1 Tax=Canavalia gladiata TaxID=3824 RepID=A0AAN9PQD4_CANGL